jgi:hypothetical protein
MPFEEQLIEAARLVRERETRHALVHLAAVREAGRIRRRPRLARLFVRITRPLRLRARPVPTGSAISHASVALD